MSPEAFGPSYQLSKSLKFFKLLSQCLNTERLSTRTIVSLGAVTHTTPLNAKKVPPFRTPG
jgi:hypothetical protein